MSLLETVKQSLTRSIDISIHPVGVTAELVDFVDKNLKQYPGKTTLRFNIYEPKENLKLSLYSLERSFMMNEEMADYLLNNPDFEINVGLVNTGQ